jgi:alanine racemase
VDDTADAVLSIDLDAIVANWRALAALARPAECAAVVKADAYGLGAARVVPALAAAGCRTFFVATLAEAIAARAVLPPPTPLYVLNGAPAAAGAEVVHHALRPVLGSLADIAAWAGFARASGRAAVSVALHVDTGMARLGLPPAELAVLAAEPERLRGLDVRLVMSHLACADEPGHPLNARQREAFAAARTVLPPAPASFANSSGVFLGPAWCFDLARPGAALYGVNPTPGAANPMQPVIELRGRILQVRTIEAGASVGYGATYRAQAPARIATVAVGYADGYFRSLSNRASGYLGAVRVPLVGRVSMDLTTFDVSGIPEDVARPGAWIELIGRRRGVDAAAADAGTIGYEVLTALGRRFRRDYRGGGSSG